MFPMTAQGFVWLCNFVGFVLASAIVCPIGFGIPAAPHEFENRP